MTETVHYAVFNFSGYTNGVAFPSKHLEQMLADAYMVYTGYNSGGKSHLEQAESIVDQKFYSVTPADMRRLIGPHHKSADVHVIVSKYGSSLAVPVSMIKSVLSSCYVVAMEYPLPDTQVPDDAVLAGDQVITFVKALSQLKFEIFELADIRVCQAQGILSSK